MRRVFASIGATGALGRRSLFLQSFGNLQSQLDMRQGAPFLGRQGTPLTTSPKRYLEAIAS